MRSIIVAILFVLTMPFALGASLDEAKANGQVIEAASGYVEAAPGASPDIRKLVEDVNARRREAYERIAKKNQISVDQVARESYRLRHGN